ncbi:MAG: hypothetical protein ACRCYE_14890 [Sarcina sp.]
MLISKFRDLVLMEFSEGKILTIACHNHISDNEENSIEGRMLGYLTTRVALFKTLSYRALPKVVVNSIESESESFEKQILLGIQEIVDEFNSLNFDRTIEEENIVSNFSEGQGMISKNSGITVIGEEEIDGRCWEILKGDYIIKVGQEFTEREMIEAIKNDDVENLLSMKGLKVVLDYSKDVVMPDLNGHLDKIKQLEETNGIEITLKENFNEEIKGYDSSFITAIVEKEMIKKIEKRIDEKIEIIGEVSKII